MGVQPSKFMPQTTGEHAYSTPLCISICISQAEYDSWDLSRHSPHQRKYACRLEAVQDLGKQGMQVAQLDVSSLESVNATVANILKSEGRIDLLICNAGMSLAQI